MQPNGPDPLLQPPAPGVLDIASHVPATIGAELLRLGRVVDPHATEALYAPLHGSEPYAGLQVQRDMAYGADPRHLLDIFTPLTAAPARPALVFVHGGAFVRGDRRIGTGPFNDNVAVWAARQGCVGINITYRLAPVHGWPAAQLDIRDALNWLHTKAAALGIDARRVVLMGHSAGAAHVAQYLAFSPYHEAAHPVAGVILLSGLFDPSTAEANPALQAYFGHDRSEYADRSAIPGLVRGKTPIFLACAELDPTDFWSQNLQLQAALKQAGRPQALHRLMGHSHMSELFAMNTPDMSLTTLASHFMAECFDGGN
jgi:triacylglycerol lipase